MIKKLLENYLGNCARQAIRREKPRIIAVAGSVGKSSTKEAIRVALGAYLDTSKIRVSPKNYNNELGVPLTVFNLPAPGTSVFSWLQLLWRAFMVGNGFSHIGASTLVLEFGTDHPGDLAQLISIAPPDISVLTAIGPEHTEYFGSVEGVAEEELGVIRALPKNGVAILNADDLEVMRGKSLTDASIVTFGEAREATVRLMSSKLHIDPGDSRQSGLEIFVIALGEEATFKLSGVFGKPHAMAVAAALAVCHALDEDFYEAVERLKENYHGMPGRTRLIEGIKHTVLLDDSYNSSPLAALSAVRDLASYPISENAKRIAALGDMLELGSLALEAHERLGRTVAEAKIDMLVSCGTLAHAIAAGAKAAGMTEESIFMFASSAEAGRFIQEKLKQGDVVLIKGSQGARMEKITKELMADPLKAKELLVRQTEEWV